MRKYIDAEAAVETFRLWFERIGTKPSFEDVQTTIQQVPAADVEPVRHGRWEDAGGGYVACSECGEEHSWVDYRASYCENCGAHMDEEVAEP